MTRTANRPPWLRCDILNGTALFLTEFSSLRLGGRWTAVLPAVAGVLWTCTVCYDTRTGKLAPKFSPPPSISTQRGSCGPLVATVRYMLTPNKPFTKPFTPSSFTGPPTPSWNSRSWWHR